MLKNPKVWLIISIVVLIAVFGVLAMLRGPDTNPQSTPTSQARNTLSNQDAKQIEAYSRQFATRYTSYTNPTTKEYLESIRPFVTDTLYSELASGAQAAGAGYVSQQGLVNEFAFKDTSAEKPVTSVTVTITPQGGSTYTETYQLTWAYGGNRWAIKDISLTSTTQKYPYLEQ